ncbi:hypothetical protein [Sphingomonas sp.]|uniref:hypothetical protein n=1 Tax=Sphingomonas sp. TaxID=28214 RepID=UPI003F8072AD
MATRRIIGVQDNLGWFIKYEYNEDTPSSDTSVNWSWIKTTKGGNRAIDPCPLSALHCTLTKFKLAQNNWNITSNPKTLSIGNAQGESDSFQMDQYYQVTSYQRSTETVPGATYVYCTRQPSSSGTCNWSMGSSAPLGWYAGWQPTGLYAYYGKVFQSVVHGVTSTYAASQACNCMGYLTFTRFPGEHFGLATIGQKSPPWGGSTDYTQGEMTNYTFDDGRYIQYVVDPTNRVASYTDPSAAVHAYTYDDRGNITQESVTPAAGGTALVTSAIYPTTCANFAVCNKPSSITDGRGNTTSYTYAAHGGVLTETSPADANGLIAQKRYTYVQRYAVFYNDSGVLTQSTAPVWLVASESQCSTSNWTGTVCAAGAADQVVTSFDYGPSTGANNLLLRGEAVTANGITRRTCYGYNAFGDRVSETLPNANLASCS